MKISELMEHLQELKDEWGDQDCWTFGYSNEIVELDKKFIVYYNGEGILPEGILF